MLKLLLLLLFFTISLWNTEGELLNETVKKFETVNAWDGMRNSDRKQRATTSNATGTILNGNSSILNQDVLYSESHTDNAARLTRNSNVRDRRRKNAWNLDNNSHEKKVSQNTLYWPPDFNLITSSGLPNRVFKKTPPSANVQRNSNGKNVKSRNFYNSDEEVRSRPMSVYDLARDWAKHERKTSFLRLVDKFGYDAAVIFNKSLSNERLEMLTWDGGKRPKPKKWQIIDGSIRIINGRK